MSELRAELVHAVLGLRPYVLIEFKLGPDGDDDLRVSLNAGGGIHTVAHIRETLTLALESLPEGDAA